MFGKVFDRTLVEQQNPQIEGEEMTEVSSIVEAIQGGVTDALVEDSEFRDLVIQAIVDGVREAFLNHIGFGENVQMSIVDGVKEAFIARAIDD